MKVKIIGRLMILSSVFAHQPVMDMAPRWAGGYGLQLRYESFGSETILDESGILNQTSFNQKTMWLEGVYTWKRSVRATFKIPVVSKTSDFISEQNNIRQQTRRNLGDIILGLPLKKYFNYKTYTANWGLTPQVRLASGASSELVTSQNGFGLSISYSAENSKIYQFYDGFAWRTEDKSTLIGVDVNLGWHPIHNNASNTGVFLMWDGTFRHKMNSAGQSDTRFHTGPQIVVYKGNIMGRIILKIPVLEKSEQTNLSNGTIIQTGIGFVF